MNLEKELIRAIETLNEYPAPSFKEALEKAEFISKVYKLIGQNSSIYQGTLADYLEGVEFPIGVTEFYEGYVKAAMEDGAVPQPRVAVNTAMGRAGYVKKVRKVEGKSVRCYYKEEKTC